jgi:hypothetical protein
MLLNSSHINKVFSSVILVLLLLIHSVKLLHTHAGDNLVADENSVIVKSSADCSICSYQLGKDADDLVYPSFVDHEPQPISFDTQLNSCHKFSFYTAFENRGPPSCI